MKMTALQFVTEYLLGKFKTFSHEDKECILSSTSFKSWEEFETSIKNNEDDLVDWAICEMPRLIDQEEIIVCDGFGTDEGDFYVLQINDKLIRISYSEYSHFSWGKIEFDFVEQVEILVPTKTWQIIK